MSYTLVTSPAVEPINLSDVKAYLRITADSEDSLLSALIVAARQLVEQYTGRPLISQTWDYISNGFTDPIRLLPNLKSIVAVNYYDLAGVLQTIGQSNYFACVHPLVGELHRNQGAGFVWPDVYARPDAVNVRFICGYGAAASDVPRPIWQAMLLLIGHFYDNREASSPLTIKQLPLMGNQDTVGALLAPYVIPVVA